VVADPFFSICYSAYKTTTIAKLLPFYVKKVELQLLKIITKGDIQLITHK